LAPAPPAYTRSTKCSKRWLANPGQIIPVKITGNLTIRDIVQPVTFDRTLTVKSDTELEGTAKTTITRAAFELTIPNVPSVAAVTGIVDIQLQFVATRQA